MARVVTQNGVVFAVFLPGPESCKDLRTHRKNVAEEENRKVYERNVRNGTF